VTSSIKDPGADEAQKKVYNVFGVFMIDAKNLRRWERLNDRRKRKWNVELKKETKKISRWTKIGD